MKQTIIVSSILQNELHVENTKLAMNVTKVYLMCRVLFSSVFFLWIKSIISLH